MSQPATGRRARDVALVAGLLALVLSLATAVVVRDTERGATQRGGRVPAAAAAAGERFLRDYVDADGRVVRRDQGGDTVSEGQAYALLIAVALDREQVFADVWRWTEENLRRDDGLLSWQWREGRVVDQESAADADLDAARALLLAGERFDRPAWTRDGVALGTSLLAQETAATETGRVLLAGTWAAAAPWSVNPSYASPVATGLLEQVTRDPRWRELRDGDRGVLDDLIEGGRLPPDWARVQPGGAAEPTGGPQGEPARFGYDAARVPLRFAESCTASDRARAAGLVDALTETQSPRAVYDLAGSPQTDDTHPLAAAARAAALAADGQDDAAREALRAADEAQDEHPTYYGAAWAALGRLMLTDDVLGGCATLEPA